jgi:RNA polymerase sigma-70 factor (ECF subfamily)
VAFAFTIEDGRVTGIEQIADPSTLTALEIEFL